MVKPGADVHLEVRATFSVGVTPPQQCCVAATRSSSSAELT
jgi:hypothetical protein